MWRLLTLDACVSSLTVALRVLVLNISVSQLAATNLRLLGGKK
ncbi:hypothetical protein NIES4075_30070 [Tolypothrix sp. NIES-4075]|nr:hypothetical protein NIES4075_30070 [Tolypothrix sp. NIES-4075]